MLDFAKLIKDSQTKKASESKIKEIFEEAEREIANKIEDRPFQDSWDYTYKGSGNSDELRGLYENMLNYTHLTQMAFSYTGAWERTACIIFEIRAKDVFESIQ